MYWIRLLTDHFWIVFCAAVIAALIAPTFSALSVLLAPLIGLSLFLVFLKVDIPELLTHMQNLWLIGITALILLIVTPIVIYIITLPFNPTLAFGLVLLALMPAGASSPAIVDVCKGNIALASAITITTSILAPFTIPLMLLWLTPQHITVNSLALLLTTSAIIFIPLVLAQIIRPVLKPHLAKLSEPLSAINVLLIGLFVYIAFGSSREVVLENLSLSLGYLVPIYGLFLCKHIPGFLLSYGKQSGETGAIVINSVYMNNGIAIVLASTFNNPTLLLLMVLSELPWMTLPGVTRWMVQRVSKR